LLSRCDKLVLNLGNNIIHHGVPAIPERTASSTKQIYLPKSGPSGQNGAGIGDPLDLDEILLELHVTSGDHSVSGDNDPLAAIA
jgi:hypothetical protein